MRIKHKVDPNAMNMLRNLHCAYMRVVPVSKKTNTIPVLAQTSLFTWSFKEEGISSLSTSMVSHDAVRFEEDGIVTIVPHTGKIIELDTAAKTYRQDETVPTLQGPLVKEVDVFVQQFTQTFLSQFKQGQVVQVPKQKKVLSETFKGQRCKLHEWVNSSESVVIQVWTSQIKKIGLIQKLNIVSLEKTPMAVVYEIVTQEPKEVQASLFEVPKEYRFMGSLSK